MKNQMVRCADVLDIRDGTHDSPKYILEGYPLITSKNLKKGNIDFENVNYISKKEFEKINLRSRVDNGDILMPMIGTIGNPVIVNTDRAFSIKNVALFKFGQDSKFINRYICYALKSPLIIKQLNSNKRGGTQAFVSLGDIRNLEIPNVDISEQKKISDVLDKAQELIDKRKEQVAACDELIESEFHKMFDMVIDVKKVYELFIYVSRGKSPNYVEKSNVKVINQACIYWNEIRFNKIKFQNEDNFFNDKLIERFDLLLNSTGSGTLGRCNIFVNPDDGKYTVDSHVTILRPNKNCINSYYFKAFMQQNKNQKELYRRCVNGSTNQIELSKENVLSMDIIVPPIGLQNQFAEFVLEVENLKLQMQQSLTELENNFNSLMQRAFKGELF